MDNYIFILPREIQLQILQKCNLNALGIIAQLSHYYNNLSTNDVLWKPTGFLYRPIASNVDWKSICANDTK